ncbi:hypothetical protein [Streptomyces chrestomyceticus]|uniref:hypothetical protein n=1 Tax=Streptomyces chrestomyceticus TaxID=68185 RepID=UPI001583A9BF|nr:hypothetical protein [Streptomyces chrestomyceticus]
MTARTFADLAPLTADQPQAVSAVDPGESLVLKGGIHGASRKRCWGEAPAHITAHGGMGGSRTRRSSGSPVPSAWPARSSGITTAASAVG